MYVQHSQKGKNSNETFCKPYFFPERVNKLIPAFGKKGKPNSFRIIVTLLLNYRSSRQNRSKAKYLDMFDNFLSF